MLNSFVVQVVFLEFFYIDNQFDYERGPFYFSLSNLYAQAHMHTDTQSVLSGLCRNVYLSLNDEYSNVWMLSALCIFVTMNSLHIF